MNKKLLAKKYQIAFSESENISFLWEPDYAQGNFWLNALILDKADPKQLKEILETTHNKSPQ